MLPDLRHALRTLRKSPGYSLVAIAVLAIGIGANTAIFTFVDVMVLRPLPYPHADRLYTPVSVNLARGSTAGSVTYADYEDWKRERDIFADVAVVQRGARDVTDSGEPERVDAIWVSQEYFRLVGVQPVAGRTFHPSDDLVTAPHVAVISYDLWQRRFGGARDVVGRSARLGGVPTEIVGVLPPRATWPEDSDLFLPLRAGELSEDERTRRDNMIFEAIARLADDATREQAEVRMRTIASRLEQEFPESRRGWTNALLPLREYIVEPELRMALFVLLGAVAAVLVIACANLASLSLVRGTGRVREIGMRLALGASRWRVIRQLLAESLVIAVAGGLAGVAVAFAAVRGLRAFEPAGMPFADNVAVDARVLVVAAAVAALTTLLFGMLPAMTASGVRVSDALKEGARGAAGDGRKSGKIRSALVVGEVAAAVVLLVAAGLLVRSLMQLASVTPGADIDRVLAGRISLPGARYTSDAARIRVVQQLTQRLSEQPGVAAAAVTTFLPVGGGGFGLGRVFLADGAPEPPAAPDTPGMWNVISPDYFRTLGIPLKSGRTFTDRDTATSRPVIIVSESFAEQMFPGQDPIGRRIRSWRDENVLREIVGVVGDVPFSSLSDPTRTLVYIPHQQDSWGALLVAVRAASGPPENLAATLRRVVGELDPNLAVARVGTMALFARESIARERTSTMLMTALALVALTLAALGIYGVLSYSVAQRRQEMGVRLALGATPGDLYRFVLMRGLGLTAAGFAIGIMLAVGAARLMERLLYQIEPIDPLAFGGMLVVLAAAALIACLLPARRAAAADPLVALRSE